MDGLDLRRDWLHDESDRNTLFYCDAGYCQGFDDDRHSWEGKPGLRANW